MRRLVAAALAASAAVGLGAAGAVPAGAAEPPEVHRPVDVD